MSEERVAHAPVDDAHEGGCHLLYVRAHRPSVRHSTQIRSDWGASAHGNSFCTPELITGIILFLTPGELFPRVWRHAPVGSITCGSELLMMKMEELPDFRDVENKLGRKVPESLIRSFTGEAAIRCSESHARADDLNTLNNKIRFLRQQMVSRYGKSRIFRVAVLFKLHIVISSHL